MKQYPSPKASPLNLKAILGKTSYNLTTSKFFEPLDKSNSNTISGLEHQQHQFKSSKLPYPTQKIKQFLSKSTFNQSVEPFSRKVSWQAKPLKDSNSSIQATLAIIQCYPNIKEDKRLLKTHPDHHNECFEKQPVSHCLSPVSTFMPLSRMTYLPQGIIKINDIQLHSDPIYSQMNTEKIRTIEDAIQIRRRKLHFLNNVRPKESKCKRNLIFPNKDESNFHHTRNASLQEQKKRSSFVDYSIRSPSNEQYENRESQQFNFINLKDTKKVKNDKSKNSTRNSSTNNTNIDQSTQMKENNINSLKLNSLQQQYLNEQSQKQMEKITKNDDELEKSQLYQLSKYYGDKYQSKIETEYQKQLQKYKNSPSIVSNKLSKLHLFLKEEQFPNYANPKHTQQFQFQEEDQLNPWEVSA